ncbi:hypothetical protein LJC49_06545 [Ruminococcaceae bacterium OttesenSCG-928-I18]|nr:hypothetical protein [Ruminococcaceae bacterium OttesenSCG-928-I18]
MNRMLSQECKSHKPPALCLLGVICDREKSGRVVSVFEGQDIYFNLIVLGWGTAHSKILGYLGLDESEKSCFFTILPKLAAKAALEGLDAEMDFGKPGQGVAYTAPVDQACYHRVVALETDDGGTIVEHEYQMIMSVVTRGYTEELMEVARAAGATGGTVLHARGSGLTGAGKFFGITIQPEKEIVMILSTTEDSRNIMQNIADKIGPGTEVNAISFSFGVTDVMGISCDVPKTVLEK